MNLQDTTAAEDGEGPAVPTATLQDVEMPRGSHRFADLWRTLTAGSLAAPPHRWPSLLGFGIKETIQSIGKDDRNLC